VLKKPFLVINGCFLTRWGVPNPFGRLFGPTIHYALHMQAISDISYWCPAIYMAHKSEMGAKWPGHFAYALTMSYSQLREIY